MRTRFGICNSKARYGTESEARRVAAIATLRLSPYRCALCRNYHLTSRTKGMFVSRKSDKAAP